ncbi:helix-turn-helix domain-containing protein [Crocosphaera sp. Alani8]|uniref:helix-turn-helix domain-containing protein n=1 Tax=Crocosphaera sp. Alani8 TaxID=3038952 RepID=UPI00313E07C4
MKNTLNAEKLANLVRSKRGNRGLRETAKEIGNVSPSTISRVENGKTPDMDTFLALCEWLEVSPAEFIQNTEEEQDLETPEAIAIQLRADKNLDPAIANALASLVKAAYKDMTSEPEYTLEELLAGASSEDFAGEYDWGEVVGEEIW